MLLRCTHRPWHKPTCAEARASQGNTLCAREKSACTPAPHTQAKKQHSRTSNTTVVCRPHEAAQRQLQPTASTPTNADPAAATGLNTHTDGTEHTNCCTNQSARTTARCLTHVVQPPSQRPPPLQAAAAAELPRPRAPTRCRRATFAAARVPEKRCKEPLTGAQHRPPASYNAALPPPAAKGARLPAPAADCLHQVFKTPAVPSSSGVDQVGAPEGRKHKNQPSSPAIPGEAPLLLERESLTTKT